ncbi:MAG: TrmH family RNA methyltransferase [Pseudomonadota bacterium]
MEIVFILDRPEHPANVGGAARAIKTTGHRTIRLIQPLVDHLSKESIALAHGSKEILEGIETFSSLSEAAFDCDVIIATTARHRRCKIDYTEADDLPRLLSEKGHLVKKVALLFGGERSGLSDEMIRQSDLVSTLPLATTYPSLNLSQAVMLYAYILRTDKVKLQTTDFRINKDPLDSGQHRHLVERVMDMIDLLQMKDSRILKEHVRKALGKVPVAESHIIHEISKRVASRLKINKDLPTEVSHV